MSVHIHDMTWHSRYDTTHTHTLPKPNPYRERDVNILSTEYHPSNRTLEIFAEYIYERKKKKQKKKNVLQ